MKKIIMLVGLGLLANAGFAQQETTAQPTGAAATSSSEFSDAGTSTDGYQSRTFESVGKRQPVEYSGSQNSQAQLEQARENVKIDEQNVQKAEARKEDAEAQLDVSKKSIKKYEAQLEEDRTQLDAMEKKLKEKKE